MTKITGKQKKYLKGLAHNNPVVMVGNKGISEAVLKKSMRLWKLTSLSKLRKMRRSSKFRQTVAEIEEKAMLHDSGNRT